MAVINGKDIHKLIVACDAGMGSSVMLASQLRKELKKFPVEVSHTPVASIPADADVVVTHTELAARARQAAPGIPVVPFEVFLGDPAVKHLVSIIKEGGDLDV
jgi:mannitol-specific phosphotransferase system IIBC component